MLMSPVEMRRRRVNDGRPLTIHVARVVGSW